MTTEQHQVWLVSQGEYSAYEVVAVFSTGEAANEYVRIRNEDPDDGGGYGSEFRVEDPRPLYHSPPTLVKLLQLSVWLLSPAPVEPRELVSTFDPSDPYVTSLRECQVQHFGPCCVMPATGDLRPAPRNTKGEVTITYGVYIGVHGTDHTRVRKVMSEHIARAIAEWDVLKANWTAKQETKT